MKANSLRLVVVLANIAFLFLGLSAHAQNSCTYTFQTSKKGKTFEFCVSSTGNIAEITANGVKQLSTSGVSGYTVRINSDFGGGCGFDYGSLGNGGWDGPVRVTQPNGTGTLPILVFYDMVPYHLTETITQVAASNLVQVKMAVFSEVGRGVNPATVTVTRVADFDIDNTANNWLDHSLILSWAYNQDGTRATLYPSNYAAAFIEEAGVVANPKAGFDFCNISSASTPFHGDGAVYSRTIFEVHPQATKSVTFAYQIF
ncbi:MAG: hypothetical protein HY010_23430 [Acidobacteria bacterium]|nr:hypothetical protein [Acidobacteriota bacterium]